MKLAPELTFRVRNTCRGIIIIQGSQGTWPSYKTQVILGYTHYSDKHMN